MEMSKYTQEELKAVLDPFTQLVTKLPYVHETGISAKVKGGRKLDYQCLVAYVDKKFPIDYLHAEEIVPSLYEYRGKQYPTDVQEIGEVKLEHH